MGQGQRTTVIVAVSVVFAMVVLSFASVPLYRIFCAKTSYGGTPQQAYQVTAKPIDRFIEVRFTSNTQRDLDWHFEALQTKQKVQLGKPALAFYKVTNLSAHPITGIAAYNVAPDKAAPHFVKIKCFCFEDQKLEGGQTIVMPVEFYIDPALVEDEKTKDLDSVTLSYTFFESKRSPFTDRLRGR
ncbi:MAG: cytochrome c oxidase assembly protein [Holosporales bacterium]